MIDMHATMARRPRSRSLEPGFGYCRYRRHRLLQRNTEELSDTGIPTLESGDDLPPELGGVEEMAFTTVQIIGGQAPVPGKQGRDGLASTLPSHQPIMARTDTSVDHTQGGHSRVFRRTNSCGTCRITDNLPKRTERLQAAVRGECSTPPGVSVVSGRRPHTAMGRLSYAPPPSCVFSSSRVRSSSDGIDNDTGDLSSEVEDARTHTLRPQTPGNRLVTNPRPVEMPRPRTPQNLEEREVYNKCKAWVSALPERFSGLNNVLSIPADSPVDIYNAGSE